MVGFVGGGGFGVAGQGEGGGAGGGDFEAGTGWLVSAPIEVAMAMGQWREVGLVGDGLRLCGVGVVAEPGLVHRKGQSLGVEGGGGGDGVAADAGGLELDAGTREAGEIVRVAKIAASRDAAGLVAVCWVGDNRVEVFERGAGDTVAGLVSVMDCGQNPRRLL